MPESNLDRELRRVRERQERAMGDRASAGSTREGVLEAGARAALQYAVEHLDPAFADLEAALGVELDAGAFLMGAQAVTLAMQGVDMIAVAKSPLGHRLFLEFIEQARNRERPS